MQALRPLPATPLGLCREVRVPVSRFSTIQVLRNTYSVPSRLIGTTLLVRVRSETLEVYRATAHLLTHAAAARAAASIASTTATSSGRWSASLAPSPTTATATICSPASSFRRAYDALHAQTTERADRDYVRLLHLAASTSESEVEAGARAAARPARRADLRRRARPGPHAVTAAACPSSAHRVLDSEHVRPSARSGGRPCLIARPRCGRCCAR